MPRNNINTMRDPEIREPKSDKKKSPSKVDKTKEKVKKGVDEALKK